MGLGQGPGLNRRPPNCAVSSVPKQRAAIDRGKVPLPGWGRTMDIGTGQGNRSREGQDNGNGARAGSMRASGSEQDVNVSTNSPRGNRIRARNQNVTLERTEIFSLERPAFLKAMAEEVVALDSALQGLNRRPPNCTVSSVQQQRAAVDRGKVPLPREKGTIVSGKRSMEGQDDGNGARAGSRRTSGSEQDVNVSTNLPGGDRVRARNQNVTLARTEISSLERPAFLKAMAEGVVALNSAFFDAPREVSDVEALLIEAWKKADETYNAGVAAEWGSVNFSLGIPADLVNEHVALLAQAGGDFEKVARDRLDQLRPGRLNHERLLSLSADNPEREHLEDLAEGMEIPLPDGFVPNGASEQTRPRPRKLYE